MKKVVYAALGLAAIMGGLPVCAATFTFSPPNGSYQVGQDFNVNVYVDSREGFDTVRANLKFSADNLEIKNFTRNSSFSFPSGENGHNNQTGTFSYGAGIPGGISQGSTFGTITFRAKSPGQATLEINGDSLILSDGENKFDGKNSTALFSLTSAATPTPSSPATPKPQVKAVDTKTPAAKTAVNSPLPDESPESEPIPSEQPLEDTYEENSTQADYTENAGQRSSIISWIWWVAAIATLIVLIGALWYIWKTKS